MKTRIAPFLLSALLLAIPGSDAQAQRGDSSRPDSPGFLPGDVVLPEVNPPSDFRDSREYPPIEVDLPRLRAISVVAIDAGHGGDDRGAKAVPRPGQDPGSVLVEKDLTLAIARKAEAAILAQWGARVIVTRTGDVRVSPDDRAAFANEARADLLISIHANSSPSLEARGFRIYYHDPSGTIAPIPAPAAAARIRPKPWSRNRDRGPSQAQPWDAAQRGAESESARFAEIIRESLVAKVGLPDGGVRRLPITTLRGSTAPAVLIEVGFLSNPEEALALSTDAVQDAFAEALAEAVLRMDAVLTSPETTP